jgi:23S rRNA pseudouridine2605 synthase
MTDNENSGMNPSTRIGEPGEFQQRRSFKFYHREGDEEGNNTEANYGEQPRGERRFGDRKFGDRPRRRFDDDDRPRRRFDDDDRPRRRFDDDDRPRRRFDDDKPRRRFDDDDRPRRKFDDDRPRRRFDDDDRPRRRFDDDDRPRRRFDDDRPRRRFDDDDRPRSRRFDDDRPRRRFDDDDRPRRRFDDDRPRRRFDDDDRPRSRRFDDDKPRRRFDDDRRGDRRYDDRPRRRFDDEEPRRGRKGYVREKDPMYDRPAATGEIRLNKYLADCGICSRREADDLIKAGCVMVNDEVITTMGYKVKTDDKVVYGGQTLNREKLRYLLLNKPKGYITTSDDPYERETVMQLIKGACNERLFPVGRLDKNTTGLLLFTNDGDLAKKLTHPSSEVPKLYQVTLDKALTKNDMLRIAEGIELDDGPISADAIAYVEGEESKKVIGIELHSGRNRIVRRIFEHLGYEVEKLDRVMFAGLDKYRLPRGEWRFLTDLEVVNLKKF